MSRGDMREVPETHILGGRHGQGEVPDTALVGHGAAQATPTPQTSYDTQPRPSPPLSASDFLNVPPNRWDPNTEINY